VQNIKSTNQVLCDTRGIKMYYLCFISLQINSSIILAFTVFIICSFICYVCFVRHAKQ